MPRSGIGLNDLLGRRCPAPRPNPWPNSTTSLARQLGLELAADEARTHDSRGREPAQPTIRSRLRVIVLVPKLRLSEAKVPHEWPRMPLTRVRSENAANERNAATRSEPGYNTAANQRPNA